MIFLFPKVQYFYLFERNIYIYSTPFNCKYKTSMNFNKFFKCHQQRIGEADKFLASRQKKKNI